MKSWQDDVVRRLFPPEPPRWRLIAHRRWRRRTTFGFVVPMVPTFPIVVTKR